MVRAFLALELSEDIRTALGGTQDALRKSSAGLTFVNPAQIHITVQFLGEVEDKKIPLVIEALKKIRFYPFAAKAGRVIVNNPRRPFTVWCEIEDERNGARLRKQIEDLLAPLGFLPESRPFKAHATVARVKRYDPSLMEALRNLPAREYGTCTITGIKLKKSTLTKTGPVYEDLLEVVF